MLKTVFSLKFSTCIAIFCTLVSCNQPPGSAESTEEKDTVNHERNNLPDSKDSLNQLLEQAVLASDSLKSKFNFVQNDFPQKSYYHKCWRRNAYSISDKVLMAGVDSAGTFFLVSNYHGGTLDLRHDRMEVKIDTAVYKLVSDTLLGEFRSHFLLCACTWEVQVYSTEEAYRIGKLIAENESAKMSATLLGKNKAILKLSTKEKGAIRDAWLLSENFRRIALLQKEIAAVEQELSDD